MNSRAKEPSTAPQVEQWYPLTLGSSLRDQSSTRFYNLRYEFKPASIDTSRPGSLHKSVENKVTVEFSNNQAGKPKVSFQGNSEECKDLDAVIFFDGKSFRLERLHKAVKSLRHVRLPGESAATAAGGQAAGVPSTGDHPPSPGHLNGGTGSISNLNVERTSQKALPVQVEEISIGQPDVSGKKSNKRKADANTNKGRTSSASAAASPFDAKSDPEVQVEVDDEGEEDNIKRTKAADVQQYEVHVEEEIVEEHESDYEIEDVDVSEGEGDGEKGGVNAAEALRAQAAAENEKKQSSSESGSSGSGSSGSGSGSGSSSTGSDASDDEEDSGTSGDDI